MVSTNGWSRKKRDSQNESMIPFLRCDVMAQERSQISSTLDLQSQSHADVFDLIAVVCVCRGFLLTSIPVFKSCVTIRLHSQKGVIYVYVLMSSTKYQQTPTDISYLSNACFPLAPRMQTHYHNIKNFTIFSKKTHKTTVNSRQHLPSVITYLQHH